MAITISSVSVQQGTGGNVKESVLEVTFNLAADGVNASHVFDVDAQIKLSGSHSPYVGGTWVQGYLHGALSFSGITPGTSKVILIKVPISLSQASIPLANYVNELLVQIRAKDTSTSEYSAYVSNAAAISLKAAMPTITTATMPHYIGNIGTPNPYNAVTCALAGSNGATSPGNPAYFRIDANPANLADGAGVPSVFNATPAYSFLANDTDGAKSVSVRVYDSNYNSSAIATFTYDATAGHLPWLQKTPPSKTKARIVSAAGSSDYAGIRINSDGTFTVDRTATLYISASSPLPMTFNILSTSNVQIASNIGTDLAYSAGNSVQAITLCTDQTTPSNDDINRDASVTVAVQVKDAAGNMVTGGSLNATIRLNTRIYLGHHYPMRPQDSLYRHVLRELSTGNNEVVLPQTMSLSDTFTRTWNDIFYPATHGYPTDAFGNIDTAAAIAMGGVSNSLYDAVVLQTAGGVTSIVQDDKGRPQTTSWTTDNTKNYGPMLSATVGSLVYWTLDNGTNGDFQLEFEWFDLNSNAYGPPYNSLSPYRGDVLVVYDATDPASVTASTDAASGLTTYVIADSTKLKEVQAFTGSGNNVINLTTGQRVNSNTQGGFKGDFIRGIGRVVIILYTDAAGQASGFKLKASQAYPQLYTNWHVDESNAQIWIHKHSSLGSSMGAADSGAKRFAYDYLDRNVQFDLENGKVTFASDPGGEVRADYTHYTDVPASTTTMLASEDDIVEYIDAYVYVLPSGTSALTDAIRAHVYESDGYGRVTTHVKWNTDQGVMEWDALSSIPAGRRMVAEYTHHTFPRLSDDGYGNLTFNDPVVVADNTPAYPDYTYADIVIYNEGDAMLEQATLTFVPRGYDTDGKDGVVLVPGSVPNYNAVTDIVDQVLDINRPWDVQMGTRDETYDRMACAFASTFIWPRGLIKTGGTDPNNQSATGILNYWKGRSLGNIPSRGRVFGRVVWVLGGPGGSDYPANVTAGKKCTSLELDGKYYSSLIV